MRYHEVKDKLLEALDEAIHQGHWQGSLFYKNILKQLLELRKYVEEKLGAQLTEVSHGSENNPASVEAKEGYEIVYISLYQAETDRMDRWLLTIKSLTEQYVSRPVYRNVAQLEELIRAKRSRTDGYVAVWVKSSDILLSSSGVPIKDRLGNELLTLQQGCVQLENIIEFVHDGRQYRIIDNQLVAR